jgi:hypothetical protein
MDHLKPTAASRSHPSELPTSLHEHSNPGYTTSVVLQLQPDFKSQDGVRQIWRGTGLLLKPAKYSRIRSRQVAESAT